jgi:hypothetical protein
VAVEDERSPASAAAANLEDILSPQIGAARNAVVELNTEGVGLAALRGADAVRLLERGVAVVHERRAGIGDPTTGNAVDHLPHQLL